MISYVIQTYRLLCGLNLPVSVNAFAPWTLTKSHIRISLRIAVSSQISECFIL